MILGNTYHLALRPVGGLPPGPGGYTNVSVESGQAALPALPISGFDYVLSNVGLSGSAHYAIEDLTVRFELSEDRLGLVVRSEGEEILRASYRELIERAQRATGVTAPGQINLPRDSLRLDMVGTGIEARIYVMGLTLQSTDDGQAVQGASGTVLLRRTDPQQP